MAPGLSSPNIRVGQTLCNGDRVDTNATFRSPVLIRRAKGDASGAWTCSCWGGPLRFAGARPETTTSSGWMSAADLIPATELIGVVVV
eukprot:13442851-Alexandrium_andersonii.AAC.1